MNAPAPFHATRILTRDGFFTDDHWPVVSVDGDVSEVSEISDTEAVLLPLNAYLAQPQAAAHGVWLAPTDDPAALMPHLASVPLIAVQFPKFADGRGYSIAHLLRRLGYAGDLRAIGEVLIDQLFMLKRVGFSSFALRADQNANDARASLTRYSTAYQGAFDSPLPAYRHARGVEGRAEKPVMNAITNPAASVVADARPALWQRPRPQRAPASFDALAAQLHAAVAAIGARFRRAALASSLSAEDTVLTHAIASVGAAIDVFMIDTGRLHQGTLAVRDATEKRLGLPIQVVVPDAQAVAQHVAAHGRFGFYDSVDVRHACCHLRKVEPLERALAGRDAWLTGQRRAHGPERAGLQVEEVDGARGMAKFNPLAAWSDDDVWHYIDRHALPVNALYAQGYPSIGCEPCTRAIRVDEDPRAGRWWWESASSKECGLHVKRPSSLVSERI